MTTDKNREKRLRRMAARMGYRLSKRRGRDANWCGPNYVLMDSYNVVKLYGDGCTLGNTITLNTVERYLKRMTTTQTDPVAGSGSRLRKNPAKHARKTP